MLNQKFQIPHSSPPPPPLPWRVKLCVFILALTMDLARTSYGFIWRRLITFADLKTSPSKTPINGVKTSDITVDPSRNLWFRLYTPTATVDNTVIPVIVYFHGGGFVFMAPNSISCDHLCYRLARQLSAVVVSVNYRLAPEHRYPSRYEDGFDVLKFLDNATTCMQFPTSIRSNLKYCFVAGDSAGGNLAHHVVVRASKYNNFNNLRVKGLIAIQPFFGGEERTESELRITTVLNIDRTDWMWKSFLPDGVGRDHHVVNVFGPNSVDISGVDFPRTIVFIGGFDPLQDWQRRYCEGLKNAGKIVSVIEYPNAIHIFYIFPELPESGLMIDSIREFIQANTN